MFICLALSDIEKLYILHLFLYQKFSDVRQRTDECTLIKMQGAIIFFVYKSRTFNSFLLYWIWQKQIRTLLRWKQVARMCIHTSYFVLCTWHKKNQKKCYNSISILIFISIDFRYHYTGFKMWNIETFRMQKWEIKISKYSWDLIRNILWFPASIRNTKWKTMNEAFNTSLSFVYCCLMP